MEQSLLTNADGVKEIHIIAQRLLQVRHVYEEGIVCSPGFCQLADDNRIECV